MDRVLTAIERAALPKRMVYSDFAAAPAMISDGEVSDGLPLTARAKDFGGLHRRYCGMQFSVNTHERDTAPPGMGLPRMKRGRDRARRWIAELHGRKTIIGTRWQRAIVCETNREATELVGAASTRDHSNAPKRFFSLSPLLQGGS